VECSDNPLVISFFFIHVAECAFICCSVIFYMFQLPGLYVVWGCCIHVRYVWKKKQIVYIYIICCSVIFYIIHIRRTPLWQHVNIIIFSKSLTAIIFLPHYNLFLLWFLSWYDFVLYVMLYMDFCDPKKIVTQFDLIRVFQCPFFFISLIHIWHHFSFGLFFFSRL
jgi:hypothetical protein